jgi:hypothetical protein
MKLRVSLPCCVVPSVVLVAVTSNARAAVINVPADFATLQAAIDAASSGDTVLVAPGTSTGAGNRDLDFGGKLITLRGTGGAALTTLDAQATFPDLYRVFDFHSGGSNAALVGDCSPPRVARARWAACSSPPEAGLRRTFRSPSQSPDYSIRTESENRQPVVRSTSASGRLRL